MRALFPALFLLLAGCPTTPAGPRDGEVVEFVGVGESSNFPMSAAGFTRGRMFTVPSDRTNFTVEYDAPDRMHAVAFLVEHDTTAMELRLERDKRQITDLNPGAALLVETDETFEDAGITHRGKVVRYRISASPSGGLPEAFSELVLIQLPDRYVRVRSTAPTARATEAQAALRELMHAVHWAQGAAQAAQ
jgi:hypothetical protein